MKLLLIGMGTVTVKINGILDEHGHQVAAQIGVFSTNYLEMMKFDGIVFVGPEAEVNREDLVQAAAKGKHLFLISAGTESIYAYAESTKIPTFGYPPTQQDIDNLLREINKAQSGAVDQVEQYRKRVLNGSQVASLSSIASARRKIVITSPKGGTGKTTISVNLASLLAMCGVETFLVDADANGGSMPYHLRIHKLGEIATLYNAISSAAAREVSLGSAKEQSQGIEKAALAGEYLRSFTSYPDLPTLKILPGLDVKELGSATIKNRNAVSYVMSGLFEAGVSVGGVVIMDVGINPTTPLHSAALANAEAIAIVIKPEVPDIAATRGWVQMMIEALQQNLSWSPAQAREFILPRIKICYNMVTSDGIDAPHKLLQDAIAEDLEQKKLSLPPNAIIPFVDPHLAHLAVNSQSIKDMFVWRYRTSRTEELEAFVDALTAFAINFVPIRDAAAELGFIPGSAKSKKKASSLFGKK